MNAAQNILLGLSTAISLQQAEVAIKKEVAKRLGKENSDELTDFPGDVIEDTMREIVNEVLESNTVITWAHNQVNMSISETISHQRLKNMANGEEDERLAAVQKDDEGEYPIEVQLACLIQQVPVFMFHSYLMGRDEDPVVSEIDLSESIMSIVGEREALDASEVPNAYVEYMREVIGERTTTLGLQWVNTASERMFDSMDQRAAYLVGLAQGLRATSKARS
jgi:hypothetical protein